MKVQASHKAQWDRTSSEGNREKHPTPKKAVDEKTQVIWPKSSPMKQQGNDPASGQVACLPMQRTPDARFKLQTEGPTALKEQRLEHPLGSTPEARKPEPSALASEHQDLTSDGCGNAVVAAQLGGPVTQWEPGRMIVGTPLLPPEPESAWHIVIQTLKNPAQMLYQSYAHLGALVFKGRYATEQELGIARKMGAPVDVAAKTFVPAVGYASAVATAIDAAEQWAKEGTPDPQALFDAQTAIGKPDQPGAVNPQPSGRSKSNATTFKPPRRFEDGRVGYPLSPTAPPRLPEPSPSAQQHALSPQPPRTLTPRSAPDTPASGDTNSTPSQGAFDPPQHVDDERIGFPSRPLAPPRPLEDPVASSQPEGTAAARAGHAAPARADAPPGPSRVRARQQQAPPFRPEFRLQTLRDPQTGAIRLKEFAREETYTQTPAAVPRRIEFKTNVITDGYTSNYRNKGDDAIVLHGSASRVGGGARLMYQRGRDVAVQRLGEEALTQHQTFDFQREVTPRELLAYLKRDQEIDLVSPRGGGTGSSGPLYVLVCGATAGGSSSLAQQFADATQREVRAHSDYVIRVPDPNNLESSDRAPRMGSDHPFSMLIKARNAMRETSRHPEQLIHKKFRPRSRPVASTPLPAVPSNQPLVFQQYPRAQHSPFTSTQPSLATFTSTQPTSGSLPSFSQSEPSASHYSSVPASRPGGSRPDPRSGSAAFFDHPAPPKPPTQFTTTQSSQPLHASSTSSIYPPQSEAPHAGSTTDFFNTDFFNSSYKPPLHPLQVSQRLPQHAMVSSSTDSISAKAAGTPSEASAAASSTATGAAVGTSAGTVPIPVSTSENEIETWV